MNNFRLSSRAELDLAEIQLYIARDNPRRGETFVTEFFDLFARLADQPLMGELRADLRPNLRLFSHGSYVVMFYPRTEGVDIAGVIHSARDLTAIIRRDRD